MTTRPTTDPTWATDATVISGPEATLPTRVTPSDGVRQQGFVADQALAARMANGQLGAMGDWIAYIRDTVKIRNVTLGLSAYIQDNSLSGPGPQTVDNTPRAVRDSDGNALSIAFSAKAGDRIIVEVGPLFVVPIYIPSGTPTVYVAARLSQGATSLKGYQLAYEAANCDSTKKLPLHIKFEEIAPATGTYSVALLAWALKLNDSVSIWSPGQTDSSYPLGAAGQQQWGSVTVETGI